MSFEEIQSIWNSQPSADGAIDREALFARVVQRDRSLSRIVTITDFVMMGTLLFVAGMFFRDPLLQGHDVILILPGIACLAAIGFVWNWRMNRQRRQMYFDSSLMGMIDRSIDNLKDRISHLRSFLLWFGIPNASGLVIAVFIIGDSKRHLLYLIFGPAFLLCMGLTFWQIQREIKLRLDPEIKHLGDLRAMLEHVGQLHVLLPESKAEGSSEELL